MSLLSIFVFGFQIIATKFVDSRDARPQDRVHAGTALRCRPTCSLATLEVGTADFNRPRFSVCDFWIVPRCRLAKSRAVDLVALTRLVTPCDAAFAELPIDPYVAVDHEVFGNVMRCGLRPLRHPSPENHLIKLRLPVAVYFVIEFTYVYVGHTKRRRNRSDKKDGSDHLRTPQRSGNNRIVNRKSPDGNSPIPWSRCFPHLSADSR